MRLARPRTLTGTACALALGLSAAAIGGTPAKSQTDVSILTGGTAGVFYVLGAGMAEIIINNSKSLSATAESTSATVENIRLIDRGQGDFAFVINDALYYAYNGGREFERKYENLRTAMYGHLGIWQIAVMDDSGIETLQDLKGKRLAHLPGTTGQLLATVPLEASGVSPDEVELVPLSLAEAVTAIKDGTVDAISAAGGVPLSGMLDLATTNDARFLGLTDQAISKLREDHPYYQAVTIEGGAYPGQDEAVRTYAMQYALMTNKDEPNDVVEEFVSQILAHTETLAKTHPSGRYFGSDNAAYADGALVPFHPGAEAALKEAGAID